jgi:glycosyltransferase involved in cell wall biosynthesis
MKITIIQGAFFPVPPIMGGAVEKIWFRMGQEFARAGHAVTHISRAHPELPKEETIEGVRHIRVRGYDTPASLVKLKFLDLLYSLRAIRHLPDEADIIVTNTFWLPLLLRGKTRRKIYVSVERVPRGQMRFYQRVGKLRGCSPAICAAIQNELPAKSRALVSYVPNPLPFDVDIQLETVKKEKVILFVGRIHPEKGVHVLIKAFGLISESIKTDWRVVVVGPWEAKGGGGGQKYFEELKASAKGMRLEFFGPVYQEAVLKKHYAAASIFCYPVQDGSGDAAPVAPREAMAFGCVPVVSSLPCFNDFIANEENGLVFNPNAPDQVADLSQQLERLMSDATLRQTLSRNAFLIHGLYSAKIIARKFLADFELLVKNSTRHENV